MKYLYLIATFINIVLAGLSVFFGDPYGIVLASICAGLCFMGYVNKQ